MLQPVEYEILDKWFNFMIQSHDCNLDVIFYLRTNPETCLKRLNQRGRPEEHRVSIDYLRNLHEFHESWLGPNSKKNGLYRPASVIVIDGDQSIDDVYKTIEAETRNAFAISLAN